MPSTHSRRRFLRAGGSTLALAADSGQLRWRVETEDWVDGSPAIGHGAVFVADQAGTVYAIVASD